MSDEGRKDFTQKAKESMKPDSEKSYLEMGKEHLTNAADSIAGMFQPNEDKGVAQGIFDSSKQGKNKAEAQSHGNAAKEKLDDSAEYISNKFNGGND